jgi:ribonuclease III
VRPDRETELRSLERRIGHRFSDLALLERALTHTSRANEDLTGSVRHNEPLEFLGDAVLGLVVTDMLHRRDPEGPEGAKSRTRAHLVAAPTLAARAEDLGLPELLVLGRGEEKTGGRRKTALWADAYEALVAAIYLDGGFEAAHRFIRDEFAREMDGPRAEGRDHKSALQELLQGRGQPVPDYVVAAEEGPSHRRRFRVRCVVEGQVVAEGEGYSKKEAQQDAARQALLALSGHEEGGSGPGGA